MGRESSDKIQHKPVKEVEFIRVEIVNSEEEALESLGDFMDEDEDGSDCDNVISGDDINSCGDK